MYLYSTIDVPAIIFGRDCRPGHLVRYSVRSMAALSLQAMASTGLVSFFQLSS